MDTPFKNRLLIIDDEDNMLHMLSAVMRKEGYDVVTVSDGQQGLDYALAKSFDFILCDLKMPKMDGLAFLEQAKIHKIDAAIIMMSAYATVDTAVKAMKNGAYDFITKPFKIDEVLCILEKADERLQLKKENLRLRKKIAEFDSSKSFQSIVGDSQCMKELIRLAEKAAGYDTTVLITGESGTGKELIARGIHNHSNRSGGLFIGINCGSIPENLLESEFFGYAKGAFTGADTNKKGLFEEAEGGTLFLDEIGELPLGLQVKLLRVLQEREVRPIGASKSRKLDVRILSATAKDLEDDVANGRFRQDLYYRLNVITVKLPPLRERKEDILLLSEYFIDKFSTRLGCVKKRVSKEALRPMIRHDWPGNVRELENCMERAVVMAEGEMIYPGDLPVSVLGKDAQKRRRDDYDTCSLKKGKKILEYKLITRALILTEGNKSQAALLLEISYPSLLSKMKELDIGQGRSSQP